MARSLSKFRDFFNTPINLYARPGKSSHKLSQNETAFMKVLKLNQRGQGTVEYILLLVVSVGIILGGILQLNRAFATWANNYFGDYLSCLLETGELPSLGSPEAATLQTCNDQYQEFTFTAGRPPISSPTTNTGNNGGGVNSDDRNKPTPRPTPTAAEEVGGRSGRTRVRSAAPAFSASRTDESGRIRSAGKPKENYTGSSEVSSVRGLKGSGSSGGATQDRSQQVAGAGGVRQTLDDEPLIPVTNSKGAVEDRAKREDKIKINRKLASAKANDADVGFTLGNFLRILIIAGIIIAIFFFFAGQAVQINKSM